MVVLVKAVAQTNEVVKSPGAAVVAVAAEPMGVHVHTLIMLTTLTPSTATIQPQNGKGL